MNKLIVLGAAVVLLAGCQAKPEPPPPAPAAVVAPVPPPLDGQIEPPPSYHRPMVAHRYHRYRHVRHHYRHPASYYRHHPSHVNLPPKPQ